ncbi:MAG TPA: S41 family peptidase [Blastocatellia bacterium]|nr:S41 family peptidase [Blastocatellia bacterium]
MTRKFSLAVRFFCFFLAAASVLLPRTAHTQQTQQTSSVSAANSNSSALREERNKLFDQVWRLIYDNYYDKNFRGIDWRQQRDVFRPMAESATNNDEFYRVIRQMIGKLGDAHTRIYSPDDGFDRYRPSGLSVGLVVRQIEGKPVVTWVEPGSEAAKQGIRQGFVVAQVDGESVEKSLQRLKTEIGESSTSVASDLQSYDRLFYGPRNTTVKASFIDDNGQAKSVELLRRYTEFQRRVISRQLPYNVGYVELTGFGPEIERDFDQAMQQMQGTQGLIVDLRNNGGGFVTTVTQIASYFFPEETDLGEFITRFGRSTRRRTLKLRATYREPVVVLVSSRSASGAEIFAAAMQERKRALVIGSNPSTCGCLLGVSRTIKLFDGGKLNISDTDYRSAYGRRIEGIGVKPDKQIETKIKDLIDSRDRVLEAAVESIGRSMAFGRFNAEVNFKLLVPDLKVRPTSHTQPYTQIQR